MAAASVAVAAARSAAVAHSATAAARWQQRGGCGGEAAAVAAAQVFVLGRGRRDDSVDSIVVVGSDGVARGDIHRGRRCAAAADDDGEADDIVC